MPVKKSSKKSGKTAMFDSLDTLFNTLFDLIASREGRLKDVPRKESLIGRWTGGYMHNTSDENSLSFMMEDENCGESVQICVDTDQGWRDEGPRYSIYVTKRFNICSGEEPCRVNGKSYPGSEDILHTLVDYICELHSNFGLTSLFLEKNSHKQSEEDRLRNEVERLKADLAYTRKRLRSYEDEFGY